jgi:two-component system, sensor histidine kinase PdtaS
LARLARPAASGFSNISTGKDRFARMSNDIAISQPRHYPVEVTKAKNKIFDYLASAAIFLAALGVRYYFDQTLPPGFPFVTFFPAVIVTAFMFGSGPAIFVAILGFLSSWYFFIPPYNGFALTPSTLLALAFYVLIVGVDIFIIDRLMRVSAQLLVTKDKAQRAADDRRLMFTEAQHRIGNNLQAISSLLLIQSRTVTDDASRRALTDSVRRVSIIAGIQRQFHDMTEPEGVIDAALIEQLVTSAIDVAGVTDKFDVSIEAVPLMLDQERFTAVSLILTECVNNSLEHAVPVTGKRKLSISLKPSTTDGQSVMIVADDGDTLPEHFDPAASHSIGMKVILSFARQIGGTFSILRDGGTVCRLDFPAKAAAH